jgi:hypothetical protein
MGYSTVTDDRHDRLRDEIRSLRDEIRRERHRIDLIVDVALIASMLGVTLLILVIGLTR